MNKSDATGRLEKRLRDLRESYDRSVAASLETTERTGVKYIAFQLESEVYAWPVSHTGEIMEYRNITPIPGEAPLLHGIINNKNQIVSVLNLHRLFHLPQPQMLTSSWLILTRKLGEDQAFLVDRLLGIYQVDPGQFAGRTPVRDKDVARYIKGEFYQGDTLISVLVPEAFGRK